MNQRCFHFIAIGAIVAAGLISATAVAQPGGGGGGRGFGRGGFGFGGRGGGGGIDAVMLLNVDEVKKEIEVTEDQQTSITALIEESRNQRRGAGGGGGERPNFEEMSDEERQAFFDKQRKEREEQAKKNREKLTEILLPHQMDRLDQIVVQTQGVNALRSADVTKKMGMSEDRQKEIVEVLNTTGQEMQEKMREIFESGDREGMREKMQEMRKEMETSVLAKLTDDEKKSYEELKGKPFELPEGALRGPGGPGGPGGQGRGRGGNRPNRPDSI